MTLSGLNGFDGTPNVVRVLIPLLVDDPLWADGLNCLLQLEKVLIPLLVDDPLWAKFIKDLLIGSYVLIPLLVDDPLWVNPYICEEQ